MTKNYMLPIQFAVSFNSRNIMLGRTGIHYNSILKMTQAQIVVLVQKIRVKVKGSTKKKSPQSLIVTYLPIIRHYVVTLHQEKWSQVSPLS